MSKRDVELYHLELESELKQHLTELMASIEMTEHLKYVIKLKEERIKLNKERLEAIKE